MTMFAPLWLQGSTYSAQQFRDLTTELTTKGVFNYGYFEVSEHAAAANMSVDVSFGRGIVIGSEVTSQGAYMITSDAVENVALATAPTTSGQSRIDLIVATVRDSSVSGTHDDFIFQAVTGVAAASPVAPAVPASSLVLAQVAVGNSVIAIYDANITDKRVLADGSHDVSAIPTLAPSFDGQIHGNGDGSAWIGKSGVWERINVSAKAASAGTPSKTVTGGTWIDIPTDASGGVLTIPAPGYPVTAVALWTGALSGANTIIRTAMRDGTGAWAYGTGVSLDAISGSPTIPCAAQSVIPCTGLDDITAKVQGFSALASVDPSTLVLTLFPA